MSVTIYDFYADWCGPCKQMEPVLEEIVEETGVEMRKINVDDEQDVANEYQVRSLPTILFVDSDGQPVERFVGFTEKEDILSALEDY